MLESHFYVNLRDVANLLVKSNKMESGLLDLDWFSGFIYFICKINKVNCTVESIGTILNSDFASAVVVGLLSRKICDTKAVVIFLQFRALCLSSIPTLEFKRTFLSSDAIRAMSNNSNDKYLFPLFSVFTKSETEMSQRTDLLEICRTWIGTKPVIEQINSESSSLTWLALGSSPENVSFLSNSSIILNKVLGKVAEGRSNVKLLLRNRSPAVISNVVSKCLENIYEGKVPSFSVLESNSVLEADENNVELSNDLTLQFLNKLKITCSVSNIAGFIFTFPSDPKLLKVESESKFRILSENVLKIIRDVQRNINLPIIIVSNSNIARSWIEAVFDPILEAKTVRETLLEQSKDEIKAKSLEYGKKFGEHSPLASIKNDDIENLLRDKSVKIKSILYFFCDIYI